MPASHHRITWALLLLRLAVGGLAIFHGIVPLQHASGAVTLANGVKLGLALAEVVGGALMIAGVWMLPAVTLLVCLMLIPIFGSWHRGCSILAHRDLIFRMLVTLASGLAGGGKWAVGG